jgi:dTDP-4-amino-4,6-dideoxygalactose transaminase
MGSAAVPLFDMRAEIKALRAEIDAALARVLDSGVFIGGPELEAFEGELAAVTGATGAVGVSSGTDALLVSLMALGVAAGDEVVTTAFTFFATAGTVARMGATPVFVDITDDLVIDPEQAAAATRARTRAVVPVNLFGRPAELPRVGCAIIEDSAQSLGPRALRATAAAVSFFPTKNVGALGDAGAVLSNDPDFLSRVKLLRTQGAEPKYHHVAIGGNFRLDALQAAVLRTKLPHIVRWTQTRRAHAERYRQWLGQAGISDELKLPADHPDHVYHQFVIRTSRRDDLRSHLARAGIGTEIYYPEPLHLQPCFASLGYRAGRLPRTEAACQEVLALPIFPGLTAEQQRRVVDELVAFFRGARRAP